MGAVRFGVPEQLVLWLKDQFNIDTFIETGTNKAETASWAADHFASVVTIEGQSDLHRVAVAAHGHRKNIRFLQGDSRDMLGPVLEAVAGPAVVWLDAHWCGEGTFGPQAECPLLEELKVANRSRHDDLLLIDDARLFLAPPPVPHRADNWPSMLEVAAALNSSDRPRYAAVFEDVIVAVPAHARSRLAEFIRANTAPSSFCGGDRFSWRGRIGRMLRSF